MGVATRAGMADLTPEQWDRSLVLFPDATFFHQYQWMQLVQDVYGGEPHYLAVTEADGVRGLLPIMVRHAIGTGRVAISVPMADEAGILERSPGAGRELLDAARAMAESRRVSYIEVRQRREPPMDLLVDFTRVSLDLPLPSNIESLWDGLKANVRNQVRKATKSGLRVAAEPDAHAAIADAFYPVYSENTRDLGSPMHSERFFHEVADRFPESVQVAVVREGRTVVGGAFALRWRGSLMVPWASSLRRYFGMCPNNILYWELMRLAIEHGCQVLDFGRSPVGSGTYRFKAQWGAEPVQLHYCYVPVLRRPQMGEKREGLAYRVFSTVWPRMPLPLARAIGPKLFARLPI